MKYADAGVDVRKAEDAMAEIKGLVKSTFTPEVAVDFGSFGGVYSIAKLGLAEPLLVASTDGVGTKLRVAIAMKRYANPGRDIVNHCVNDILVQGARPLFFLDYFATGKLETVVLVEVVRGLSQACKENGCALIGGETAEMPGVYHGDDFDLAGTIVGAVDRSRLVDGKSIRPGDLLLGLESTGLHTNGYSLARKICFEVKGWTPDHVPPGLGRSIGDALVEPHRSYLRPLWPLLEEGGLIKGLAHITGGGFQGNIPRILPAGTGVEIDRSGWSVPAVFRVLQAEGQVEDDEMHRTFNMGIGMVIAVAPERVETVKSRLEAAGEKVHAIGRVTEHRAGERVTFR